MSCKPMATLAEFVAEAERLAPDSIDGEPNTALDAERDEFCAVVRSVPGLNDRQRLELLLLAAGVIERMTREPTIEDIERFHNYKPVPVLGEPLSETIIRERR